MSKRIAPVAVVVVVVIAAIVWKVHGCPEDSTPAPAGAAQQTARPRGPHVAAAPAALSGHVTRKAGGPVAGAVVALVAPDRDNDFSKHDEPPIVVTTDAAGAWSIDKAKPGDYMVSATANGCLPASLPRLSLAPGESRTGIDLVLEPGGTVVKGTVSDVGGGPIGAARVSAISREILSFDNAQSIALTGPDGHYELSLPDGTFQVRVEHDDYTSTSRSARVQGKPLTLDFVLVPGAVVRGQVVARDTGKPVPGAQVSGRVGRGSFGSARSTTTDADGKFALRALAPGTVEVSAVASGYATKEPVSVQIGVAEQVDGVRVVLDHALSISGRIVDKASKAGVAGVHVAAFSFGGGGMPTALDVSAEDGAFEIPGVKPGTYTLFAIVNGKVPEVGHPTEVKDKDVTGVVLEVSNGATLSGRIEPAQAAAIELTLAEPPSLGEMLKMVQTMFVHGQSDAAGVFKLEHVPAGKFKLVASTSDGTTGELPVEVADRDQPGLVVRLEARASISGRVVDSNGAPVPDLPVRARALERERSPFMMSFNRRGEENVSAPDGTFRIVGLEAGKYEVSAEDWMDMLERAGKKEDKTKTVVELAAGAARTGVTITVEARDGVIRGSVVDSDGKAVADAWVTVARQFSSKVRGMDLFPDNHTPLLTNSDGKFTADHLRRGTYRVIVDGPRGASHGEQDDVKTGTTVTVKLAALGSLHGRVTLRGAPVASYELSCRGPGAKVDHHIDAADGAYVLDHLAPGHYSCDAEADTGTAQGEVDVPSDGAQLDLQLGAWATLTGTVVDAKSGAPLPGLAVVTWGGSSHAMSALIAGDGPTTDQNGRFRIEQVASGAGSLSVLGKSIDSRPLGSQSYKVEPGQVLDLGLIKITPNGKNSE